MDTNHSLNPFSSQEVTKGETNSLQESEGARAIQEVQAAMVIAKKFPRDEQKAMERILNACTRSTLADSALYSYPKGGQVVTGPSIRLAETMAQHWQNMQFGIRELSVQNGVSTVEAFAWDIETNTRQVKTFQVSHQRYTRANGLTQIVDPRDIYEHVANMGARRLRACILGVIPGDVTEAAVRQCDITLAANIEVTPETIKKMLESFKGRFGITDEMISQRLGMKTEAIRPAQMLNLRKIFASLNDGMSKPGDWFDVGEMQPQGETQSSDLTEKIKSNKQPAKQVKAQEHSQENATSPSEESSAFKGLQALIDMANTEDDLDSLLKNEGWTKLQGNEPQVLQKIIDDIRLDIRATTQTN